MKKIYIFFVIFLSAFQNSYCNDYDPAINLYTPIIHHKDFHFKEKNTPLRFIKKYALTLSLIPFAAWHYADVITLMQNHPYISTILLYSLLYFSCDTLLEYQEEESLLSIIIMLKKIATDLIVLQAIDKHFIHKTKNFPLSEKMMLKINRSEFACNEEELALMTFKLYQEIKAMIHQRNPYIIIESEEFIFLSQPSIITMDTALYITQRHHTLHEIVFDFYTNPEEYFFELIQFLHHDIRSVFTDIEASLFVETVYAS